MLAFLHVPFYEVILKGVQACVQFEDRVFDNGMLRSQAISTLNAVNKAATPAPQAVVLLGGSCSNCMNA